uniref:Fam-c protein n=1 Tax=Strongyloides venezuelensis TaxID=75913 RepID=A0A0K0F3S3_STRVS
MYYLKKIFFILTVLHNCNTFSHRFQKQDSNDLIVHDLSSQMGLPVHSNNVLFLKPSLVNNDLLGMNRRIKRRSITKPPGIDEPSKKKKKGKKNKDSKKGKNDKKKGNKKSKKGKDSDNDKDDKKVDSKESEKDKKTESTVVTNEEISSTNTTNSEVVSETLSDVRNTSETVTEESSVETTSVKEEPVDVSIEQVDDSNKSDLIEEIMTKVVEDSDGKNETISETSSHESTEDSVLSTENSSLTTVDQDNGVSKSPIVNTSVVDEKTDQNKTESFFKKMKRMIFVIVLKFRH